MKPSWDDSPIWAQWLAMDKDGMWFWYSLLPDIDEYQWCTDVGKCMSAKVNNWENSLQERPEDEKN